MVTDFFFFIEIFDMTKLIDLLRDWLSFYDGMNEYRKEFTRCPLANIAIVPRSRDLLNFEKLLPQRIKIVVPDIFTGK